MDAWTRILLAVALVALAVLAARFLRPRLERRLTSLRTPSFGRVFARLITIAMVSAAVATAVTMVAPGVDPAGILAGAGLLTVAAGFAFQDILSNLLAGILLIFRQPFTSGDQVEVGDVVGTIKGITLRETEIETFQGRLVFVPNKDVYENAIVVQTHNALVRTDLDVGVAYGTDLDRAEAVALASLVDLTLVAEEPAPMVHYTEFGGSSITMQVRYFSGSEQAVQVAARTAVIKAIHQAFGEHDIDIPFDIITLESGSSMTDVLG